MYLGLVFVPPARQIQIILNDFMRVSQDSYPYSFFSTTKTATFAASNVTEAPMSTIRLVGTDGFKRYKKVKLRQKFTSKMTHLFFSSIITCWFSNHNI